VRADSTLPMDGQDWETPVGFLARRLVTVSRCMIDPADPPWIEHEGKRHVLHPVDPCSNARRHRPPRACLDSPHEARTAFDPPKALVDKSIGRTPDKDGAP
jgi:putative transposase